MTSPLAIAFNGRVLPVLASADAAGHVYAEWDESKHPRDDTGRWSSGGDLDSMLAGLPIKDNPNLPNEATTHTGRFIEVGPKFHTLSKEAQREVLTHEAGHFFGLDDWYLKNHTDWDLAAYSKFGHLNGQTVPGEIIAEAYSVAWHDPKFLQVNAPRLIPILRRGVTSVGLAVPPLLSGVSAKFYSITRPLYVSRPVLNAEEIIAWAKDAGFATTLPAEDMHVTVCYSKEPVDWLALEHWVDVLEIPPEGVRTLAWDESKHPRDPGGEGGGQFVRSKGVEYQKAGKVIDGLVVQEEIPDQATIGQMLVKYKVLPGVREVPLTEDISNDAPYIESRVHELMAEISKSGKINPLIVVVDDKGPYVLEGAHRFAALVALGKKSFPALVVLDTSVLTHKFSYASRAITNLGDEGAVVLLFESALLQARHQYFLDHGASWDYESYHPHITLTYDAPEGFDLSTIEPYTGRIVLGPEVFTEVEEDWAEDIREQAQEEDGVWRTVRGRKVFIREGEDLDTALKRSLGDKKEKDIAFQSLPIIQPKEVNPGVFEYSSLYHGTPTKGINELRVDKSGRVGFGALAAISGTGHPLLAESFTRGEFGNKDRGEILHLSGPFKVLDTNTQSGKGLWLSFGKDPKRLVAAGYHGIQFQNLEQLKVESFYKDIDFSKIKNAKEVQLFVNVKPQAKRFAQFSIPIKINYTQIKHNLDKLEVKAKSDLHEVLSDSRDALLRKVKKSKDLGSLVRDLELPDQDAIQQAVHEMLLRTWKTGSKDAQREVKTLQKDHVEQHEYADLDLLFTPKSALKWLLEKSFWVTGLIAAKVENDVKGIILNGIKTGAPMEDMASDILLTFMPYLGKPGVIGDEQLVTAHRLETIVRTNTTDAYNHGRLTEFVNPDILPYLNGLRYSAILDERTTPVCRYLDGKVFKPDSSDLASLVPPNHMNCRSLIVPVVVGEEVPDTDFITVAEVRKARSLADTKFLEQGCEEHEFKFDPSQTRAPPGTSEGGQWVPSAVAYHGTFAKVVDEIKSKGIDRAAYVTTSFEMAKARAQLSVVGRTYAQPIVVKLSVPKSEWSSLRKGIDESDPKFAFERMQGIPPEWVADVMVLAGSTYSSEFPGRDEWEVGTGTYISGTLTHDMILASSHALEVQEDKVTLFLPLVIADRRKSYEVREFYDPDQPRDPQGSSTGGQWTTVGGGFSRQGDRWLDSKGRPASAEDATRLKAMKVPPAWTEVRLNPDVDGALQVIGKDSKGRRQYLYSAKHSEAMAAEKFARLKEFNRVMPKVEVTSRKDMLNGKLESGQRDAAAVTYLISRTGFRIGVEGDTGAEKQAYGATTLLGKHVKVRGDTLDFVFTGKKGVIIEHTLKDAALAGYVKGKGVSRSEKLFSTSSGEVRDYFKGIAGDSFNVKDMRTWKGTSIALREVKSMTAPSSATAFKRARVAVGKAVASALGNTHTIALAAYIDPAVFSGWGFQ